MTLLNNPRDYRPPLWPELGKPGPKGEPPPVPLKEYARLRGIHPKAALDRIRRGRVYATKVKFWMVYLHTER